MKKLLLFAILALGLVACGQKEEAKPEEQAATPVVAEQAATPAAEQTLTFSREDGEGNVVVSSADNFEKATITIGEQKYEANRAESADGIKMATADGKVSVHFKGTEGMLELDGTETTLTEVK